MFHYELTCFSGILQSVLLKSAEHCMNPIWCCVPGPNWFQAQADSILAPALTPQHPLPPFRKPQYTPHTPRVAADLSFSTIFVKELFISVDWCSSLWSGGCATINLSGYVGALREASCIYFAVLKAADTLDTY